MSINEHFKEIENKVKVAYVIAEEARKKGLDPKSKVEIPLATSLAGRAIGLVSILYPQLNNDKTINRILELEKEHGALDPAICLKIAEEIAKEKFCKFQSLQEGIDAGIRAAIAYTTLGVVSSPIEGFTNFKLNKTRGNGDYIAAYFSGPIRSAGGTAAAFSLVIVDYLRETFGYAKYDPTEQEVKRFVSEIYDYHERITNLQYLPSEQEVEFLATNLPIQVTGEASEEKEVSNYKDLERIETNMIRSGPCLVLAEGLAQKAPKILKMVNKLKAKGFALSDWGFLKGFVELQQNIKKNKKKAESATYIQDLVAGRPVFAHPSKSGAFRLRYGRTRCSGYSALSIHPATMYALKGFVAVGTQLKIELPTKGAAITACDSIEGPIVRMNNDSVRKLKDIRQAKEMSKDICEIIYLGDLLVPYGDFLNRNHILMPCGYTQEQWLLELRKNRFGDSLKGEENKKNEAEKIDAFNICFEKAAELSERYKTAIHPDFTYYWSQIAYEDFMALLDWLAFSRINERLIFPYNKTEQDTFKRAKRALELIGCCHDVTTENVVLSEEDSRALLCNLGLGHLIKKIGNRGEDSIKSGDKAPDYFLKEDAADVRKKARHSEDMIRAVNTISNYAIKDKAGTFIGARMGRPEKAKLRKLTGNPNVLFPVGEEGGRMRSVQAACKSGSVKADFPIYFCENCNKETIYFVCENCNKETKKKYYCKECGQTFDSEKCPQHALGQPFASKRIEVSYYLDEAAKKMNLQREEVPQLIKGVKGTSSSNHAFEHLCKGILRAIYNLTVNKDGTIRYDATELPITHFKPKEISTGVEMLKKLGYGKDINGMPLENDEQILEIKPHDIILPACPETKDEKADDVFIRISKFIDSMLVRFYNQKPFYNI
ncbi:DNA polymerase II large subunit, partial [Candidatus Pacearchaeota archaeon]|nr:DNA polymerase II large subunit [Candidatus Pacearchaeota archaeon]